MSATEQKILVIGYGNPGRLDDGLGPALAEAIASRSIPGVSVDANYQLTIEDAADISEHAAVVFADAAISGPEPFFFEEVEAKSELGFSSHHMEPAAVLGLARDMFGASTRGFALGIRGYEFDEFGERLSAPARANLDEAISFLSGTLERGAVSALAEAAETTKDRMDPVDRRVT